MSDEFSDVPSVDTIERKGGGAAVIVTGMIMLIALVVAAVYLVNRG